MANTRYCAACVAGHPSQCQGCYQAPSSRDVARRTLYTYKYPNRAMSPYASGQVVKL